MRITTRALGLLLAMACTALAQGEPVDTGRMEEERPADSRLNRMISPVSSPTVNEDPRNITEIRPLFIYHRIPDSFLLGSGNLQVGAVQLRVALTDRFSFIATKDGYIWLNPDATNDDLTGWANLAFGFKGSLLQSEEWAAIISAGLRYETPWGSREVFQGYGGGMINPFVTAAKGFGDFHAQLYTGPRLAIQDADSSFYDTNLHFDYRLPFDVYPLFEVNWLHILTGGTRYPFDQEASELVNLGSFNSSGDIVTMAFGFRWRVMDWLDLGATGEFPVTSRKDIFDYRVTWDMIIRPFAFDLPPWPWV